MTQDIGLTKINVIKNFTPMELKLLNKLLQTPNQAVSNASISLLLWKYHDTSTDNNLKAIIYHLRQKLKRLKINHFHIETIRAIKGYALVIDYNKQNKRGV